MALPLGVLRGGFVTAAPQSAFIERAIVASRNRVNLLRGQGFIREAEIVGPQIFARVSPSPIPARAPAISLPPTRPRPPGAVSGAKSAFLECQARGGQMVLGRCLVVSRGGQGTLTREIDVGSSPTPLPRPGGIMGIRAAQLMATGGSPLFGQLLAGGLDLATTLISQKFGRTPAAAQGLNLAASGVLQPAGGGVGMATVASAIALVGGTIVGTIIRVSRAGWARVPALIKQAAVALGLTVALTDIEFAGGGVAGELSMAQQTKIAKFTQMTDAGVPPNIAAKAVGIGRRRRKGISAFELRGFSKISHMLSHFGMVPRGLHRRRVHHHHPKS